MKISLECKRILVRTSSVVVVSILALASGAPSVWAQDTPVQDDRPGLAVFEFANGGSYGPDREDFEALGVGLQQMLLTELMQNSELRIVERSVLREILAEQDLAEAGRIDPATAAEIGRLVGARYSITGVFADLWGSFRIDARIIDGETGEILRAERVRGDREDIYGLLVELSGLMTAAADLPPLPAVEREAREAREIPAQAITLYSRAQVLEDLGETDGARELYQRIVSDFPQMVEAEAALRQLPVG
ncbi:MAG: CsgG/HfaB family protein [Gemmatimonadota bacterium]